MRPVAAAHPEMIAEAIADAELVPVPEDRHFSRRSPVWGRALLDSPQGPGTGRVALPLRQMANGVI